jgi:hypothetical protein
VLLRLGVFFQDRCTINSVVPFITDPAEQLAAYVSKANLSPLHAALIAHFYGPNNDSMIAWRKLYPQFKKLKNLQIETELTNALAILRVVMEEHKIMRVKDLIDV